MSFSVFGRGGRGEGGQSSAAQAGGRLGNAVFEFSSPRQSHGQRQDRYGRLAGAGRQPRFPAWIRDGDRSRYTHTKEQQPAPRSLIAAPAASKGKSLRTGEDNMGEAGQDDRDAVVRLIEKRLRRIRRKRLARWAAGVWKWRVEEGRKMRLASFHSAFSVMKRALTQWKAWVEENNEEWKSSVKAHSYHCFRLHLTYFSAWMAYLAMKREEHLSEARADVFADDRRLEKAFYRLEHIMLQGRERRREEEQVKKIWRLLALKKGVRRWRAAKDASACWRDMLVLSERHFNARLSRRVLTGWRKVVAERRKEEEKLEVACTFHSLSLLAGGMRALAYNMARRREKEQKIGLAVHFHLLSCIKYAFACWRWHADRRQLARQNADVIGALQRRAQVRRIVRIWYERWQSMQVDREFAAASVIADSLRLMRRGVRRLKAAVITARYKVALKERAREFAPVLLCHSVLRRWRRRLQLEYERKEHRQLAWAEEYAGLCLEGRVFTRLRSYFKRRRWKRAANSLATLHYLRSHLLFLRAHVRERKERREGEEDASAYFGFTLLRHAFSIWAKLWKEGREEEEREATAEGYLLVRMVRKWRRNAAAEREERLKVSLADEHRSITLLANGVRAFYEKVERVRRLKGRLGEARHHCKLRQLAAVMSALRAHTDTVKKERRKLMSAALTRRKQLLRFALSAFHLHFDIMKEKKRKCRLALSFLREHLLSSAFLFFSSGTKLSREKRQRQQAAASMWRRHSLGHSFRAWLDYVVIQHERAQLKVAEISMYKSTLSQGTKKRCFSAWLDHIDKVVLKKSKQAVADQHHQRYLQRRCFHLGLHCFWLEKREKKRRVGQAALHYRVSLLFSHLHVWKVWTRAEKEEREGCNLADAFFSSRFFPQVVDRWAQYAKARKGKREGRSMAAAARLGRIRSWAAGCLRLGANSSVRERVQRAIAVDLDERKDEKRRVEKYARRWRQKARIAAERRLRKTQMKVEAPTHSGCFRQGGVKAQARRIETSLLHRPLQLCEDDSQDVSPPRDTSTARTIESEIIAVEVELKALEKLKQRKAAERRHVEVLKSQVVEAETCLYVDGDTEAARERVERARKALQTAERRWADAETQWKAKVPTIAALLDRLKQLRTQREERGRTE